MFKFTMEMFFPFHSFENICSKKMDGQALSLIKEMLNHDKVLLVLLA